MSALLEVQGLHKSFDEVPAVRGVDLTVESGQTVAIIGPNGAGKSTLFGAIAGEHSPNAGRIEFAGEDVTRWGAARLARRGLSRTFQVARFFGSMSVQENLLLAASSTRMGTTMNPWRGFGRASADSDRALSIMEELNLSVYADAPARNLSQGDRKRLELAMALSQAPKLLLLDEPTAGMSLEDTEATIELLLRIKHASKSLTVILTAHDMDVVFTLSDHVVLMGEGAVVIEGTPSEIEAAPETRRLYLGDDAQ